MSQENKERARRGYETISAGARRGNLDDLDALADADLRDYNPDPGQAPGLQGVKDWFLALGRAFPDLDMQVEDLVAEGDQVVARARITGTHRGDFQGIPPTGKRIDVEVIDILKFRNGKVIERRGLADQFGMMQQLGALPGQERVPAPR